ncbi:MAG: hypothetical protein ACRDBP_18465, partial [Luteolibacter sp.]
MKLTPTTALVALALIGAGGFFAGRVSISDRPAAEQEAPAEIRTTRSTSRDSAAGTAETKRTNRPTTADKPGTVADQIA